MLLVLVQGNCPVGLRHRQPGEIRGLAPRVEDRVKDFLHDRLLAGLYFQEGRTAQSSCRYPRPPGVGPGGLLYPKLPKPAAAGQSSLARLAADLGPVPGTERPGCRHELADRCPSAPRTGGAAYRAAV